MKSSARRTWSFTALVRIAAGVGALGLGFPVVPVLAQTAPAAGPAATAAQLQELLIRQQESLLLHRKVELRGVRRLEGSTVVAEPPPISRLLIVHLWAVECRPCVEEFPVLRPLLDSLRSMPQVKAVLISETADLGKLQAFLRDNRASVPQLPQYQSTDDRLRGSLQNLSQPMTLLLDERGIVRQAFLGSIRHRRSELADAVQRITKAM